MRLRQFLTCCMATILITTSQAYAWGPDGHKTVAAIAYKLIEGTHAAKEVKNILGDLCLKELRPIYACRTLLFGLIVQRVWASIIAAGITHTKVQVGILSALSTKIMMGKRR